MLEEQDAGSDVAGEHGRLRAAMGLRNRAREVQGEGLEMMLFRLKKRGQVTRDKLPLVELEQGPCEVGV